MALVREGAACRPHARDDVGAARCENWCRSDARADHCLWCKCQSCGFCGPIPPSRPLPPQAPPPQPLLPGTVLPSRLTAVGKELRDDAGNTVVLHGVNMYLEWYRRYYSTAAYDIPTFRRMVPSANLVRFVGLLWHDSVGGEHDGLECSVDNVTKGHLATVCMRYVDQLVRQATSAGFWVM